MLNYFYCGYLQCNPYQYLNLSKPEEAIVVLLAKSIHFINLFGYQ